MLKTLLRSLRAGVVTTRYPKSSAAPPPAFRGAPSIRLGGPFAALPAPSVCPSGAISADESRQMYAIDLARCLFCGRCAETGAGTDAGADRTNPIEIGRDFELAARRRQDLRLEVACDESGRIAAAPEMPADELGERAAAEIRRLLGRSLHLRHLDSGSCNACDWELTALLNPVYDVRRLGIDFVASPRHADGVIVTGPVTRNLELAVQRTWEAVPEPRIAIAVGACASSGGIVGQSYASRGGAAEVLPIDVLIPGCPPRPEAIIFGILLALGRLAVRRDRGAKSMLTM